MHGYAFHSSGSLSQRSPANRTDLHAGLRHCLLEGKSRFCFARLSFKWTGEDYSANTESTLEAPATKFEEQYALQVSRRGKIENASRM